MTHEFNAPIHLQASPTHLPDAPDQDTAALDSLPTIGC
jgi:hypothetical protein